MRMITASFAHASERFVGDLCVHFLPLFQQVVVISKTCSQLIGNSTGALWCDPRELRSSAAKGL